MNSRGRVSIVDEGLDRELAQNIFAKEIYLPWVKENHPFCVGQYSGYVDHAKRPHGPNGTWTCTCPFEGHSYKLNGRWRHGSFVSEEKKKHISLETNHFPLITTGDRDDGTSKSHSKKDNSSLIVDVIDTDDSIYIYCVGDRLRSQRHALETGSENLKSVKEMSNLEYAFIKCNDSTWTYAFLSRRIFQQRNISNPDKQFKHEMIEVDEEAMEFIIEVPQNSKFEANTVDKVITKIIPESDYGAFIRCRSPVIFSKVRSDTNNNVVEVKIEQRGMHEWMSSSTKSLFSARSA